MSELSKRIITGIILITIIAIAMWQGGIILYGLFAVFYIAALQEIWSLTFTDRKTIGIFYGICVSGCFFSMIYILDHLLYGFVLLLHIIAFVDMGAYAVGKNFPLAKLAPTISPGKSWGGLIGGSIAGMTSAVIAHYYYISFPSVFIALLTGFLMTISGQGGDLIESWLKRQKNVKDSGWILPGHGGVLDRIDGYVLSAPLLLFILISCNML